LIFFSLETVNLTIPTGAHRRHIRRGQRLLPHEFYRLLVAYCPNDTSVTARDADQVQVRAARESMRRHETQATFAWDGIRRFGDDMHRRPRQARDGLAPNDAVIAIDEERRVQMTKVTSRSCG
jgi:hypothetical protein